MWRATDILARHDSAVNGTEPQGSRQKDQGEVTVKSMGSHFRFTGQISNGPDLIGFGRAILERPFCRKRNMIACIYAVAGVGVLVQHRSVGGDIYLAMLRCRF